MVLIGENIKTERERLGLTQSQLAASLGITGKTQGLYERGQRSPSAEYLSAFAAIGGDVLFVITGERLQTDSPAAVPQGVDAEMLENISALNEHYAGLLSEMARVLLRAQAKDNQKEKE